MRRVAKIYMTFKDFFEDKMVHVSDMFWNNNHYFLQQAIKDYTTVNDNTIRNDDKDSKKFTDIDI